MRSRYLAESIVALLFATGLASAQPAPPAPAPGGSPNVFYGAVPPSPAYPTPAPVIVFVHGLHGTAMDWWVNNTAYQMALSAGFRTAFVSLSADNTPNDANIADNANMLKTVLPEIAQHYAVGKMYLVGHSKGGVDIQAAMLTGSIRQLVRAVFTISTPNQGSELADWAFGDGKSIAGSLNLLTPGVYALRTQNMAAFRQLADPVLQASGIPFYTIEGDKFADNPLTAVTGVILQKQSGEFRNDGFVTVESARLDPNYASDLGIVHADHFSIDNGDKSFAKVNARIQGMELRYAEFTRLMKNGFGDEHNNWLWSQAWYQGKLYVGTGREIECMTLLTSDVQAGTKVYPISVMSGDCPDGSTLAGSLGAEIWRFDPADGTWVRVFKSPENIFLGFNADGQPIYTARDVGFRGMVSFVESDGTEALYVGGVTSGSIYSNQPQFASGYPPPRLLRSVDGVNFAPIPQTPGTFLGDIGNPVAGSTRPMRSFRALTVYKGMLFVSVADFRGVGYVMASVNPKLGNNAWFRVSPLPEQFPVWNLIVYNNYLYATTGDKDYNTDGYAVWKTDASGAAPYTWTPVVTAGGYQMDPRVRGPNGLSFAIFKGQLYVGTNRPTELIRINQDDSWDLIAGEPRQTPSGLKTPLSGMGIGFGSWFNGHFWRMAAHGDYLYLQTWDWSVGLRFIDSVDKMFGFQYGFDIYRSADGVNWEAVTRTGVDDAVNSGGRSILSTDAGLFIGTARPSGGASLFRCSDPSCGDPTVDPPGTIVPAPRQLQSVSETTAGRQAILSWDPVAGAVRYRIYRSTVVGLDTFLPGAFDSFPVPGFGDVTIGDIRNGVLDSLCTPTTEGICLVINAIKTSTLPDVAIGLPMPFVQVGVRMNPSFVEAAPTDYQSLYYVRAEDAAGNLSRPSNFVGAPSKAAPMPPDTTGPVITATLTPPPNSAGWNNSPVTVSWNVSDPETGVGSRNGCSTVTLSTETAGTTLTCYATNGRGIPSSASVTVKIDFTAPAVAFGAATPAPDPSRWYNVTPTIAYTVSDALSGVAPGSSASPLTITAEGAGVRGTITVMDVAGNRAVVSTPAYNIDRTPPVLTAVRTPANAYGWNNTDVSVTFACADAVSGIASCSPQQTVVTTEGSGQSRTAQAYDLAGNVATLTVGDINVDKTPPDAYQTFIAAQLDLGVFGRDSLSGVPPGAISPEPPVKQLRRGDDKGIKPGPGDGDLRSYRVSDRAGNTLVLALRVKREGRSVDSRIQSVQAGVQPALPMVKNITRFEWSVDPRTALLNKLEEKIVIGEVRNSINATGVFNARTNQTRIYMEPGGQKSFTGLMLLKLATSGSALNIQTASSAD